MTPTEACIALNMLPTMGPVRLRKLLEVFETPERVLAAKRDALRAVEGIGNDVADQIVRWETIVDSARMSSQAIRHSIRANSARSMRRRSCSTFGAN